MLSKLFADQTSLFTAYQISISSKDVSVLKLFPANQLKIAFDKFLPLFYLYRCVFDVVMHSNKQTGP